MRIVSVQIDTRGIALREFSTISRIDGSRIDGSRIDSRRVVKSPVIRRVADASVARPIRGRVERRIAITSSAPGAGDDHNQQSGSPVRATHRKALLFSRPDNREQTAIWPARLICSPAAILPRPGRALNG
jgi:hypothetical protein